MRPHSLNFPLPAVTCTAQRECIIYSATIESVSAHKLSQAASILSDVVMHPAFKITDIEAEKKSAVADLSSLLQNTPVLINDLLHLSAYGKETLGRPVLMSPEYLKKVFTPN